MLFKGQHIFETAWDTHIKDITGGGSIDLYQQKKPIHQTGKIHST